MKELDDRWRTDSASEQAQAVQQLYDGRKTALDAIVADMLIEQAAKAKGQTPAQYRDAEVARRATPVTDGQIAAFYAQNQAQMQGRPLAQMSTAIRQYLEEQQRTSAFQAMVAELRKGGPAVNVVLDAPRYTVNVAADDPVLGGATAPVTLVEFSDFQCPFCARVMPTLKKVKETYGDRVRIVWKDFPLTSDSPAGIQGRGSRPVRARAGQVLGAARCAVRQSGGTAAGRPQEARSGRWPGPDEVQRLLRCVEVWRARAAADERGHAARRRLDAEHLHQRATGERRAAL